MLADPPSHTTVDVEATGIVDVQTAELLGFEVPTNPASEGSDAATTEGEPTEGDASDTGTNESGTSEEAGDTAADQ